MPLLVETLITAPGFRTLAAHRQPVILDLLPGAIDSTMSAASRFALPHVTLLAALCGGAAAQTPANTGLLALDTTLRTTPALPGGSTPGAQPQYLASGDAMSAMHGASITKPTSALKLRRTASQRRSTPLGGTDIAAGRLLPVGGVLARISAPSTWPSTLASTDTGRATASWTPGAVMSLDQVLGRADRTLETTETTLPGGMQFIRTRVRQADSAVIRPLGTLYPRVPTAISHQASATMLQLRLSSGTTWSVGRGGLAARNLGLADTRLSARLSGLESVVSNPLVALVPDHRFASTATHLGGAWTGRVAWIQGQGCAPTCAGAGVVELSHQGRHHAVNLSVASLHEDGGLTEQADAAGSHNLSPQTRTTGLTLSAAWAVSEEWLVAAAWSAARTTARLPGSVSGQLMANAYGLGLLKTDSWRPGDRLSLMLQAPLSTRAGSLSLDGQPGTQDINGTGLQPDAREWTLETRYTARLSADSAVSAAAAYKQNPDHDATAASQMAVGVRYQRAF